VRRARPTLLWLRTLTGAVLLSLLTGCAGGLGGWRRAEPAQAQHYRPRQQVQVWQDDRAVVWHGVRQARDSLSGIPYHRPLECDSCRVSLPLAAVDSVRLGNLERSGIILGALPFVALTAVVVALQLTWGDD
jgi:hypothetical protein